MKHRVSDAMNRVLERRAAEKKHRAERPRRYLRYAEHAIGLTAGLAAIFGVWAWIAEAPDREEERRARNVSTIANAKSTIAAALTSGVIDGDANPDVAFAMQVLTDYNQPILLKADRLTIRGVRLDCAEVLVEAPAAAIEYSSFGRSYLHWSGDELALHETDLAGSYLVLEGVSLGLRDMSAFDDFARLRTVAFDKVRWQKGVLDLPAKPLRDRMTIEVRDSPMREIEIFDGGWHKFPWINADQPAWVPDLKGCKPSEGDAWYRFTCPSLGPPPAFEPLLEPACDVPEGHIARAGRRAAERELQRTLDTLPELKVPE